VSSFDTSFWHIFGHSYSAILCQPSQVSWPHCTCGSIHGPQLSFWPAWPDSQETGIVHVAATRSHLTLDGPVRHCTAQHWPGNRLSSRTQLQACLMTDKAHGDMLLTHYFVPHFNIVPTVNSLWCCGDCSLHQPNYQCVHVLCVIVFLWDWIGGPRTPGLPPPLATPMVLTFRQQVGRDNYTAVDGSVVIYGSTKTDLRGGHSTSVKTRYF